MNTIARLLLAYAIAVLSFSALIGIGGLSIGFVSGNLADIVFWYFFVLVGAVVTLTVALLPLSPLMVWAAARSWRVKFLVVVSTPVYFLVIGLIGRSLTGVQDLIQRDSFERALWVWVLPATVVVTFFFVIEEALRKRPLPRSAEGRRQGAHLSAPPRR